MESKLNEIESVSRSEDSYGRAGTLTLLIECEHPENVVMNADAYGVIPAGHQVEVAPYAQRSWRWLWRKRIFTHKYFPKGGLWLRHHNAYVRSGLRNALLRESGLGGTAIGAIGVDNNATAVTFDTRFLHGAGAGTAANSIIKALSPAMTIVADGAGVAQVMTGGATFVNADFTSGVFIWNKIGFLTTTVDADGNLIDVIGGTGGAAPYNRTFSLDLTAAGAFSVTAQLAITATAV